MSFRLWATCLVLVGTISGAGITPGLFAQTTVVVDADRLLRTARELLDSNDPDGALALYRMLINADRHLYPAQIGAARASAELGLAEQALSYYTGVVNDSLADADAQRVARFGSARMLVWLDRLEEAEGVYRELLQFELPEADRQVALAGLTETLALQDHTMSAYVVHPDAIPEDRRMRFEKARAALWSDWPDKAEPIVEAGIESTPGTRYAREVVHLDRDIRFALGDRGEATYDLRHDEDDRTVHALTAGLGRHIGGKQAVSLHASLTAMTQKDRDTTLYGVNAHWESRIGDRVWLNAQAGPGWTNDWAWAEWAARLIHRPGDSTSVVVEFNQEIIPTFPALDERLTAIGGEARFDRLLSRRTRLSIGGYARTFTDDNLRVGGFAELSRDFRQSGGMLLRTQGRFFGDSRQGSQAYFNPELFAELRLLLDYRQYLNPDWRWYFTVGPGIQSVTPGESGVTLFAETRLRGYIGNRLFGTLALGYSNSSAASPSGFESAFFRVYLSSTL